MLGGNGSSLCGEARYAAILEWARFLWVDRFFEFIHLSEATKHKRLLRLDAYVPLSQWELF